MKRKSSKPKIIVIGKLTGKQAAQLCGVAFSLSDKHQCELMKAANLSRMSLSYWRRSLKTPDAESCHKVAKLLTLVGVETRAEFQ